MTPTAEDLVVKNAGVPFEECSDCRHHMAQVDARQAAHIVFVFRFCGVIHVFTDLRASTDDAFVYGVTPFCPLPEKGAPGYDQATLNLFEAYTRSGGRTYGSAEEVKHASTTASATDLSSSLRSRSVLHSHNIPITPTAWAAADRKVASLNQKQGAMDIVNAQQEHFEASTRVMANLFSQRKGDVHRRMLTKAPDTQGNLRQIRLPHGQRMPRLPMARTQKRRAATLKVPSVPVPVLTPGTTAWADAGVQISFPFHEIPLQRIPGQRMWCVSRNDTQPRALVYAVERKFNEDLSRLQQQRGMDNMPEAWRNDALVHVRLRVTRLGDGMGVRRSGYCVFSVLFNELKENDSDPWKLYPTGHSNAVVFSNTSALPVTESPKDKEEAEIASRRMAEYINLALAQLLHYDKVYPCDKQRFSVSFVEGREGGDNKFLGMSFPLCSV